MIKTKCACNYFKARDVVDIECFINEYLDKYEVINVIQSPYTIKDEALITVTIIYNKDILDFNDKELLKDIIELDHISINNAQSKLSIGFNKVSKLFSILEDNNIISDKNNGRKLLMSIDDANKIIDSLE